VIGEFDNSVFLKDFCVPMTFGDYSGNVLYDAPGTILDIASIQVPSVEHAITYLAADFPGLTTRSRIFLSGVEFEVLKPLPVDDGKFSRAELKKV
jgi:hypothetical protein